MTTSTNVTDWRDLRDKLTPEQVLHLEAIQRLATEALHSSEAHARATGQEMLNSLHGEALFYAGHNAPVGMEP